MIRRRRWRTFVQSVRRRLPSVEQQSPYLEIAALTLGFTDTIVFALQTEGWM